MKLYANNRQLAEQLLETAFGILRNEGLQPADCLAIAYDKLASGIDVSPAGKQAMRVYLEQIMDLPDGHLSVVNEINSRGSALKHCEKAAGKLHD